MKKEEVEVEEVKEVKEERGSKMTNGKIIYTISKEMKVVEATDNFSNPTSTDRNILELFLKNNQYEMERYFDDEDRYGIAFYACGYNGPAQQEFVEGWAEVGVKVF